MKYLNVGIIGAGGISECHTEGYKNLDNVKITAVCDINEQRAKAYAEKYNIPHVFTDYREMLKMDELDAVSVTTWNNGHAPISIAAMKAGKHVLCEKPLALNAAQAQQMVDTAKETGKILMVGFVRRFEDNVKCLKKSIESGHFGKVYYVKTGYIRKWGNPGGWFSDKKRSGGGPVIDLGVHVIDLVRYINGKPKPVSVMASTFNYLGMKPNIKGISRYCSQDYDDYNDVEDAATALIKFDNGMTLSFETSWVLYVKNPHNYLDIYGEKAGAQLEPTLEYYEEKDGYLVETKPSIEPQKNKFQQVFNAEIQHFVDCVVNKTPCINTGEDGVEIMKIIDAIYESSRTGHEVIIK